MPSNGQKGQIPDRPGGPSLPMILGPSSLTSNLLIDFMCMFHPPPEATHQGRAYEPVSIENLGWIRQNYFANRHNLLLVDEEIAIAEASLYKRAGGGTIVDATTIGIGRDPLGLARIARATGLNVVMGAGFYVGVVHPADMDERTEGGPRPADGAGDHRRRG